MDVKREGVAKKKMIKRTITIVGESSTRLVSLLTKLALNSGGLL